MSTSNTANNFGSPSDDAQHGVAGHADAGGRDASDDGAQHADEDLDIPVPLAAEDESYMEHLFNDILRQHGDHNRGATLSYKVEERWCNFS